MADREELLERQRILARFGEFILDCDDLQQILTEGCRLISEALGTDFGKVMEIESERGTAVVRAGTGWGDDIVGKARIELGERSSEAYAIASGEPLVTQDIASEKRFDFPPFMIESGIVAIVNVPIMLPGRVPYGVLQVDSSKPRAFGDEDIEFLRTYAMVLGPVIDRLQKVRDLKDTAEKYRMIVENAQDFAIVLTDEDDRITDWLPGAEAVFGWTEEEALGRPGAMLFTPEDRAAGEPEREVETARREGKAPNVRWHLRKDGSRVFLDGQITTIDRVGGRPSGFMKIGRDVTQRKLAEEALRESEERLRAFGEASQDILWIRDAETLQWTYLTPAFETIYGLSREQALSGNNYRSWLEMILPDDRPVAVEAMRRLREGEWMSFEYRIRRPADGDIRMMRNTDFPIRDEAGEVRLIGGIGRDVTGEREREDRLSVLVAELQHRTRNLMGIVRSTMQNSLCEADSLDQFAGIFGDRLEALARVQGLLSRLDEGERITFDELVRSELAAMGATDAEGKGERVSLDGPGGVRLRSSRVQMLALALHELATNAVKYGALAADGPGGRLALRWREEGEEGSPRLWIEWAETGVDTAAAAGKAGGTGYGRELIERALPYQLDAETTYRIAPDGVRCTIALPLR